MTEKTYTIFRGRPKGIYSLHYPFVSDPKCALWKRCATVSRMNDRVSIYKTHPSEITRCFILRILYAC